MSGWVYFEISHGPGHQSHTEIYEYFGAPVVAKDVEEHIRWELEDRFNDPVITWRRVRSLPKKVLEEKKERAEGRIESAKGMLKILGRTTVRKTKTKTEKREARCKRGREQRDSLLKKEKEKKRGKQKSEVVNHI